MVGGGGSGREREEGHSHFEGELPSWGRAGGWTVVSHVSLFLCAVRAKPGEAQGAGWFLKECGYASLANVRPNASPTQLSSK